jgi:hypothetical protein
MVTAIGAGLGAAKPWPIEDAIAEWGCERAVYALGSNSRVRGRRAGAWGWTPLHASVLDWVARKLPGTAGLGQGADA